jgi:hypothetical protein
MNKPNANEDDNNTHYVTEGAKGDMMGDRMATK